MRRRVGVGAVKKKDQKAFSSVGKSMEAEKMSTVKDTLEKFKESLSEFAEKHRQRINSDPEFRQQFHSMCVAVGVDPLASSKGFWADILGVGDFYFELGVKIIQTCVQTRNDNGGLMPMEDLLHKLRQQQQQQQGAIGNAKNNNGRSSNSSPEISLADVHRAIEKLGVLGGGFRVIKMGGNSSRGGKGVKGAGAVEYVLSVPMELNTDHEELIEEAQNRDFVEQGLFQRTHGWSPERFHMVLTPLLHEGMLWVDDHEGLSAYMLPPFSP